MKKMKRILAIVTAAAVMLSMSIIPVSAATFKDISGKSCENAVTILSGLNIVGGYNDGTFKPDQAVTRAEMAKLLVCTMGKSSQATATTTDFTDMSKSSWAIPYVALAAKEGIVNGVGNGKFDPSSQVKYNEAIKMIVSALGYTSECNEMSAGYPTAYVAKAKELGITDGISGSGNDGATRGDCAIMLYNAMTLANVYADLDGNTVYKEGSTDVIFNGETVQGMNWFSSLNTSGGDEYMIVGPKDLSNKALADQAGIAAGVFTNTNDSVLLITDDSISELLTGTISKDGKTFTADGKTYTLTDAAMKTFASTSSSEAVDASFVPYFYKGELVSDIDKARNYTGQVAVLKDGYLCTVDSAKVSSASSSTMITGAATLTVTMDGDKIASIWAVNSTPANSGRTTVQEHAAGDSNPVIYWTLDSVSANNTATITLNASEACTYGYLIDDGATTQHVSTSADKTLKAGLNTITINIKNQIESGKTGYIHFGFDTADGAHLLTTVPVKNVNM